MIAFLWYVPDEGAAEGVRAALVEDWPDRPAEVRVGESPDGLIGVEWDGATVRSWAADGLRVATASDPHVAVLFVRTWTLEIEGGGPERFLPAPLPEPEAWVPPAPPAPARIATDGTSGSYTQIVPPVLDGYGDIAVGLGTRQSTDEPLSLLRGRLLVEATRRSAFGDLGMSVWGNTDATRFVGRVHGGEQVVELAVDRAAFSIVGGWRRPGRLPLYAYGGPELRVVEWQLYVDGLSRGGVEGQLVPALVVGVGAGRAFSSFELRALPYVRATTVEPHVAVGVNVDALVRTRRVRAE